jgi:hypothetical protein
MYINSKALQPICRQEYYVVLMGINIVGGFTKTKRGHDYPFVVVDMFINMWIIMPYKRTIKGKYATITFF